MNLKTRQWKLSKMMQEREKKNLKAELEPQWAVGQDQVD